MSSEKGPIYIYAQEHKLYHIIIIIITLEDIEKMKTGKKMATKQYKEYFFHQRRKKAATNTVMASRF